MIRRLLLVIFCIFALVKLAYGLSFCPTDALIPDPSPVIVTGGQSCLNTTYLKKIDRDQVWSENVNLEEGQNYWLTATKCARATRIKVTLKDKQGNTVKSVIADKIAVCLKAPSTDVYSINYEVELYGNNSYAITDACLSKSNCSP